MAANPYTLPKTGWLDFEPGVRAQILRQVCAPRILTIQRGADERLDGPEYWITNHTKSLGIFVPVCIRYTFRRQRKNLLAEDALEITITRELDTKNFTTIHGSLPNSVRNAEPVANEAECAKAVRKRQTWSSVSKITVRDLPFTDQRSRERIETCQFEFTCKSADGREEIFIAGKSGNMHEISISLEKNWVWNASRRWTGQTSSSSSENSTQLPRGEIIVDVVDFRAIPAPTRHPVQYARTDQLRMKHTHPRTHEESQEHRTHFEAPRKHVHSA
jgi:hypothetical protein